MKPKKFSLTLYKVRPPMLDEITFALVVTNDIRRAHGACSLTFEPTCAAHGGEIHNNDGDFRVFFFLSEECVNPEWIGHELLHAVNCIQDKIGFAASRDNDEPDARLCGWLHKWVYGKLKLDQTAKAAAKTPAVAPAVDPDVCPAVSDRSRKPKEKRNRRS